MKRLIGVLLLVSVGFFSQAQDLDFTQYYSLPIFLNPALTGSFNGSYRVGGAYRDQWRSNTSTPVSTYAFNGEYRLNVGGDGLKNGDFVALGIKFFSDRVRLLEHNTNMAALNIAFHKSLNQRKVQYLSGGFEIGIVQKNLNFQYLLFEDQYNQIDGFEGVSEEMLEINNFGYGDYSFGLNYLIVPNKDFQFHGGVSLKHLSTPNVSYWRETESTNPDLVSQNNLPLLIGINILTSHNLNYLLKLSPRVIAQFQGPHYQISTGATMRIGLGGYYEKGIHVGAFTRFTNSQESAFHWATVSPFIGFEISNMLVGVTYDFLVSDLAYNYKNVGVMEFTVRYTGEVIEDTAICPEF